MLLTADWVLPVDRPPIRDGAVLVSGARIAAVGRAEDIRGARSSLRYDFPGCILTPGLVNAHTHLALTALHGLLPPGDFAAWLARLVRMMRALDEDDLTSSTTLGAIRCLEAGATVVGDIAYGPESTAACGDAGVGGVAFWETLGVEGKALPGALLDTEFPAPADTSRTTRMRVGVSPHSPYTAGPSLLRAEAAFAREHGYPMQIHVAESLDEMRLFAEGRGPLRDLARRLAVGFIPEPTTPVRYLDSLGVLDGAIAVHCVHLRPGEAHLLASKTAGVVLCPRSNAFLHNGAPPVEALVGSSARIAVGSDSLASNTSIDPLAEARELRRHSPSLSGARLLRMLTAEGAAILGVDDAFGTLTPGKQADVAVFRVSAAGRPEEALVAEGGRDAVEAVLSAGIWRVREGSPTVATKALEAEVAGAAAKARAASPPDA